MFVYNRIPNTIPKCIVFYRSRRGSRLNNMAGEWIVLNDRGKKNGNYNGGVDSAGWWKKFPGVDT